LILRYELFSELISYMTKDFPNENEKNLQEIEKRMIKNREKVKKTLDRNQLIFLETTFKNSQLIQKYEGDFRALEEMKQKVIEKIKIDKTKTEKLMSKSESDYETNEQFMRNQIILKETEHEV